MTRRVLHLLLALFVLALLPGVAFAQLGLQSVADGLAAPVGFV